MDVLLGVDPSSSSSHDSDVIVGVTDSSSLSDDVMLRQLVRGVVVALTTSASTNATLHSESPEVRGEQDAAAAAVDTVVPAAASLAPPGQHHGCCNQHLMPWLQLQHYCNAIVHATMTRRCIFNTYVPYFLLSSGFLE